MTSQQQQWAREAFGWLSRGRDLSGLQNDFALKYGEQMERAYSPAILAAQGALRAAEQARSGQYLSLGQLPYYQGETNQFRVRVFICGSYNGQKYTASMDVLASARDSISAVLDMGRQYHREVARGQIDPSRLRAESGDTCVEDVQIQMVMPLADPFSIAARTEVMP